MRHLLYLSIVLFGVMLVSGCGMFHPPMIKLLAPGEIKIISPLNDSMVKSPFQLKIDKSIDHLENDGLATHVHVLINTPVPALDGEMPHASNVIDVPSGKDTIEIRLKPGKYTIQLIAADEWHRPFIPPVISRAYNFVVTD